MSHTYVMQILGAVRPLMYHVPCQNHVEGMTRLTGQGLTLAAVGGGGEIIQPHVFSGGAVELLAGSR